MARKKIKKKTATKQPKDNIVKSCIGCTKQKECHPNGVNFDSREMAGTCPEWGEEKNNPEKAIGEVRSRGLEDKYGKDLYERCSKKIGMTYEQIAAHPDAESLLQYANGIHPASNVDARIKEGVPPEQKKFEENMPDSFTLESVLEAKFVKTNRDHFDRGNLQTFLRRINRRYGPFEPVRIVTDTSFIVKKRELVTKYVIYYKE